MKYVDDFRAPRMARALAARMRDEVNPDRDYRLMEFCGGHTHAIFRYGVKDLLPSNVRMIHGPGCPVCVLPITRLDMAIALARREGVTLCTYGDMLRVPGSRKQSLLKARAEGADVRMVGSTMDAIKLAEDNPDRQVVFFAIGFETTTPPTAVALKVAEAKGLRNFTVFCNHVLTPAAITNILEAPEIRDMDAVEIDGFLGPAHVSVVIGSQPYDYFAEEFRKPVVIAGFEPLDVMQSILMLIRQINEGRAEVENQYTRAVTPAGNAAAKAMVAEVFELRRSFEWRGLGHVPYSAFRLRDRFADFDAERRFDMQPGRAMENKACDCPKILRGAAIPTDCKLFGKQCTPQTPLGSCMVSDEGACAAYFKYGRRRAAPARMEAAE
ncbi:hydrogenase formation protein HypD [Roseibacterium beibuensis]|uniref:Hydrogenase maturation factor n=1 Tax=[Roseibacterium] beibuensis TaxID=1193142 RepID=A0ABP9KZU8_9RHOB|nr:hydrogenase formation protein HypD [Roseibacterium beibuensis]MCS6622019.1 hydrogenase formation protein HypD [Roseibacterium beibuensis]